MVLDGLQPVVMLRQVINAFASFAVVIVCGDEFVLFGQVSHADLVLLPMHQLFQIDLLIPCHSVLTIRICALLSLFLVCCRKSVCKCMPPTCEVPEEATKQGTDCYVQP